MNKLFSGRYILTVLAGLSFVYAVVTKSLSSEAYSAIIVMIFMSYFQKKRDKESG